jgi:hypothetical protein
MTRFGIVVKRLKVTSITIAPGVLDAEMIGRGMMSNAGLVFAIQRYIYDFMEGGGVVEADFTNSDGWVNMELAEYLTTRLTTHGWIKDE